MTSFGRVYKDFIEKEDRSKSTILKPLGWLLGICVPLLGTALYLKAENILVYGISVIILLIIVIYIAVYLHAYFTNQDALRSENYTLTKMAIEKSAFGDSQVGVVEISDESEQNPKRIEG